MWTLTRPTIMDEQHCIGALLSTIIRASSSCSIGKPKWTFKMRLRRPRSSWRPKKATTRLRGSYWSSEPTWNCPMTWTRLHGMLPVSIAIRISCVCWMNRRMSFTVLNRFVLIGQISLQAFFGGVEEIVFIKLIQLDMTLLY
jgi:hypothetical protein